MVEVVRGSWMSDVRVLSEESAKELGKGLQKRFEEWKAKKSALHEQKHRDLYDKRVKELYDGCLGIPMSRWNRKTDSVEYGYSFLDPDDNKGSGTLIEVWPDFPVIVKNGLVYRAPPQVFA